MSQEPQNPRPYDFDTEMSVGEKITFLHDAFTKVEASEEMTGGFKAISLNQYAQGLAHIAKQGIGSDELSQRFTSAVIDCLKRTNGIADYAQPNGVLVGILIPQLAA